VERVSQTLQELRIAEVEELGMHIENGEVAAYRAKVRISFKYEGEQLSLPYLNTRELAQAFLQGLIWRRAKPLPLSMTRAASTPVISYRTASAMSQVVTPSRKQPLIV
jgi:hypothetical protein